MAVLESTGPFFLEDIYQKYKKLLFHVRQLNSNDDHISIDFQGERYHVTAKYANITVIDPRYWLPTMDPAMINPMRVQCSSRSLLSNNIDTLVNLKKQLICGKLKMEKFRNKPYSDSYLNHHWVHSNMQKSSFKTGNLVSVLKVVPNLVSVSDRLDLTRR